MLQYFTEIPVSLHCLDEGQSVARIKDLLDAYWLLTESVQQSQLYYGTQMFVTILSLYTHITVTLYNFFHYYLQPIAPTIPYTAMQLVWVVAHISQLFLFLWPATQVTKVVINSCMRVSIIS